MNTPSEPGITVTVREMYDIMRKLEHLPEQLKAMDARLERGLETQERIANEVREELRSEVRVRDEKFAGVDKRIAVLEADKLARDGAEKARDKTHARKTPWTAIAALALASLGWLSQFVKDLIN